MTRPLFVDTSGWYAFLNARDPHHREVTECLVTATAPLFTSNYVFDELVTLVLARVGHAAAVKVGAHLREPSGVELVRVTDAQEALAWELFCDRAGRGYSFTDCASFVIMREIGATAAVALDRHFASEGFETLPAG